MAYKPPTKGSRLQIPYLALVTSSDPDFERAKHSEVEYAFQNRVFRADPYQRGAYNSNPNIYPVGQPY